MKAYADPGLLIRVALLLGISLLPRAVEAKELEWSLKDLSRQTVESSLVQVQFLAQKNNSQARLTLACFEASDFELIVIDNGRNLSRPRYPSLAKALVARGCAAGINGSFFSRSHGLPKGLVVADGEWIESFDPQALLDASLVVREGRLGLEVMDQVPMDEKVTQLVQSNPWLVRRREVASLSGSQRALRTFVATDGGSRWILGHARYCTLAELAEILACVEFQKVYPVRDALNLDGGVSSGIWIRKGKGEPFYLREGSTVMNFIGVRRKRSLEPER